MAGPDTVTNEQILIQIGNGADPEVFAHPCLINSDRGFSRTANTIQEVVPDCTNPELPGWNSTEVDGLGATISGGGMLDLASVEAFDDWFESGASRNVKVKLNKTGGRTYTGAYKLTQFDITGTRKNRATAAITLVSDGPVPGANNV